MRFDAISGLRSYCSQHSTAIAIASTRSSWSLPSALMLSPSRVTTRSSSMQSRDRMMMPPLVTKSRKRSIIATLFTPVVFQCTEPWPGITASGRV